MRRSYASIGSSVTADPVVLAAASDERAEIGALHLETIGLRLLAVGDLGLDAHRREHLSQDRRPKGEVLGERCRRLILVARRPRHVRPSRHLGLVDGRLRLGGRVLLEREEHARVLAAHAQHVRGLALLEHLDIDVGALSAK